MHYSAGVHERVSRGAVKCKYEVEFVDGKMRFASDAVARAQSGITTKHDYMHDTQGLTQEAR